MTGLRLGWWRRGLVVGGAVVMGYAVVGAATDRDIRPTGVLLFLAAVVVAHDAVVLPAVIGLSVLVRRYVPAGARAAVRVAGFVTVAVAVVAVPLVLGFGRRPDDPSALPLPYGRGLAVVLAVVWAAAGVAWLVRSPLVRRGRRDGHPRAGAGDRRLR